MKALIIDDEKPVRDAIQLLVDWKAYNIDTIYEAEDGHAAIRIIQENHPELILTDIRMPVTGGIQLMDWLYHNSASSKVIAISGYTDYEYVRQIFLQGGVDYILKPIQPQKLYDALKKAVSEIEKEKLRQPSARATEPDIPGDSIYYQIKYYIDDNYHNKNLSLSQIASVFHISDAHLSRYFKKLFGINLVQYIKNVRISHAKKHLIHSSKKISEIARLVGYDDEKYFARVFKEQENMSANDYRQKYKTND
ncbi:MAG: response regulator [Coprococcus sp.]